MTAGRPRELMIDRAIHVVALAGALAGAAILSASPTDAGQRLGIGLYVAGLFAMLACSTLHNWPLATAGKGVLRRLDHAAIFLMIAGTYSPFMIALAGDDAVLAVFAFVWGTAAAGIVLKLARPACLERLSVALYLAIGWSGVLVFDRAVERLPAHVVCLIGVGGILYTLGAVFHVWRRLPYQNAIWHGFVVAAAFTHYLAVAALLDLGA